MSPAVFNALGTPLVCPITQGGNFARHAGFAVSLNGSGTQTVGVVLCNQARVLDLQARHARFIEKAPSFIVDEVLARLAALIDWQVLVSTPQFGPGDFVLLAGERPVYP